MTYPLILVGAVVWYLMGYLGTRLLKGDFIVKFGADSWLESDERMMRVLAMSGPIIFVVFVFLMYTDGVRFHWKW